MKNENKSVRSINVDVKVWDNFKMTCKVLGIAQSNVIEEFLIDFFIKNKHLLNEIVLNKTNNVDIFDIEHDIKDNKYICIKPIRLGKAKFNINDIAYIVCVNEYKYCISDIHNMKGLSIDIVKFNEYFEII